MALEKTVTSILRTGQNVEIVFSDGSSIGLATIDDVREFANRLETDLGWLSLWCSYWVARDPSLNSNVIPVGRFTLDASAANIFRKQ